MWGPRGADRPALRIGQAAAGEEDSRPGAAGLAATRGRGCGKDTEEEEGAQEEKDTAGGDHGGLELRVRSRELAGRRRGALPPAASLGWLPLPRLKLSPKLI